MNRQPRHEKDSLFRPAGRMAALVAATIAIAACDGANQGVQIGTGQDSDPVVVDFPIAYVRAPIPVDDDGEFEQQDLREQITFFVGSDLYFRERAAVGAEDVNITERFTMGMGAIRDVDINYDASSLVFAMRGPFDPNLDEEDQPTWNIWQYFFETDTLERVIASDLTAEIGHDIMPKYLPDGRIIFSSTRQKRSQAMLLDEGKGGFVHLDEDEEEFAFNLHVMSADGTNIEQVSFNQSHDLHPSVMRNGQVVFSRWDHYPPANAFDIYRMNPDGSSLEILYGKESHDTGTNGETIQFTRPREQEDGRIMTLIRPFTDTEGGGELIVIDTPNYVENTQPTAPNAGVLNGPAQADATVNDVTTIPGFPSEGGRYGSVYPIQDGTGRLLVSWSQCRLLEVVQDDGDPDTPLPEARIFPCTEERLALTAIPEEDDDGNIVIDGDYVTAPPLYGIWMYDPRDGTQLPIVPGEEGFMFTEVVTGDPRPLPPAIPDGLNDFPLDPTLAENDEAILNIRNVYDFNGNLAADPYTLADPVATAAIDRPVRFIRIEKAVSIPDEDLVDLDNTAFGITTFNGMKEIVAYAEVQPDGSVLTRVPANAALAISLLNDRGERISPRHRNWLSARPGQVIECQGCHVPNTGVTHGRANAFDTAYAGARAEWFEFPNTDPRWFVGNPGETMAEIRARVSCADTVNPCAEIEPSLNLMYADVWSADPAIAMANTDGFENAMYQALQSTSPVNRPACLTDWEASCRSTIHYETHIHPIWSVPRPREDADGNPVLDPVTGLQIDDMCVNCHTSIDPADGMTTIVPAGQLELTDGLSNDEPDHFHAYRELLVTDNLQEVDANGVLVDVLIDVQIDVDDDGNPIIQQQTVPTPPPATIAGAAASGDFFDRFEDVADEHYELLSEAERRLIAEWLDVGAQYYNDPFVVPQ